MEKEEREEVWKERKFGRESLIHFPVQWLYFCILLLLGEKEGERRGEKRGKKKK